MELATKGCQTSTKTFLEILAAAHAECGNFAEAVRRQNQTIELGFEDAHKLSQARERLELYKQDKPFRGEAEAWPFVPTDIGVRLDKPR